MSMHGSLSAGAANSLVRFLVCSMATADQVREKRYDTCTIRGARYVVVTPLAELPNDYRTIIDLGAHIIVELRRPMSSAELKAMLREKAALPLLHLVAPRPQVLSVIPPSNLRKRAGNAARCA